ncbi:hypothetical protein M3Y99_01122300 [Aphelenchoides fujianensis]|nr:hypothetical protein M3Y99_01122300 [Aphelenchoides fujianensis]
MGRPPFNNRPHGSRTPASSANAEMPPVKRSAKIHKQPRKGLREFRIVVRNLPFATTKEELTELFARIGPVKEVELPKSKDARFPKSCAGFGFVQYNSRNVAREAVEKLNFSQFKGRKIAVDWSLSKDEYISKNVTNERERLLKKAEKFAKPNGADGRSDVNFDDNDVKSEPEDDDEEIAGGTDDEEEAAADDVKMEADSDDSDVSDEEDDEQAEETDEDQSGSDLEEEEEEEEEDVKPMVVKSEASAPKKKPKDTATEEGRVIFLRNVPFDISNEELKEQMGQYGEVVFAIMCKFPGTEQPTGNAFVHFKNKEAADKCLEELEISGIFLNDRIVEGHRAVPREEAAKFEKKTKKEGKDNRNLKLLRVSLIRPGTAQARGMSEEDAELRQRLIEAAKLKLKNLHMFVSTKRLAIHNLPFTYRDSDLHELCLKHATKNARIRESRVMRNAKGKDAHGHTILGKSKGFGFVEFADHVDALTCLRNLNNNPEVFTDKRRPIVEFSVENLNALRIQEKRRQAKENPTENGGANKPLDRKRMADQLAVQRTKREISREGLKALPKKFGEKIRHRDLKAGPLKNPKGKKGAMPAHLQGVRLNKFKKKGGKGKGGGKKR